MEGGEEMIIVLVSHGTLAEGMKNSVQFIAGEASNVLTLCAYVKEHISLEQQIKTLFAQKLEHEEWIVVSDIYGGSVNSEFVKWLDKERFHLISGMNLALILQLMNMSNDIEIEEQIKEIVKSNKEMICYVNQTMQEKITEEDF